MGRLNLFENININDIPELLHQTYMDCVNKINDNLNPSDAFNCPEKFPLFGNNFYKDDTGIRFIVSEDIENKYFYFYFICLIISINGDAWFICELNKHSSYKFYSAFDLNDEDWDYRISNCFTALDRLLWEAE